MIHARVCSAGLYIFIFLLVISNIAFSQQTASQLFEKALYIEEARGELQEAIDLYQQILKQYSGNRPVAAKALLHTGLCYEKMGNKKAQNAYQQIVNKFPDQQQEVVIAKERLSRLKQTAQVTAPISSRLKFTKINIPTKLSWCVKLSPDGKDLALVFNKKLWILPLSGNLGANIPGTPLLLNTNGVEVEWTGLSWSGDGKWIAFNEYPQKDENGKPKENQGIYIVSSAGGKAKKIIENYRAARVVNYRLSLSPDARKLAFSSVEENKQHIFTVPVDGGIPKKLADFQAREPVFSPDGQFIAFVEDRNVGIDEGDLGLYIITAEGGEPQLIADAGKASSLVWSPDGTMIAFLDYTLSKKINIIPVNPEGTAAGKIATFDVPAGIEEVRLLAGWTPDNKIGALVMTKQELALYTLPAQGGQAAMILHDTYAQQPRWSPDGKEIFYTTLPAEGDNKVWRKTLASVPSGGGSGTYLPLDAHEKRLKPFGMQAGNRISPDGKTIISAAWCTEDTLANINWPGSHIWKISIGGLKQTKLTYIDGRFVDLSPSWSPDGKKVAFLRYHLREDKMDMFGESSILTINSDGSDPQTLVSESGKSINSPVWSPDGQMIAYFTVENDTPKTKMLNIINLSNGKIKVLGEVPAANFNTDLAWSPDSKRIAFNDADGKVIKIMNLDDGSIEDIETGLVDVEIYHLDWSPDGKKFVFGGFKGGKKEFWLIEDFLPLVQKNE